jgi:hypothetical protein
MENNDKNTDKKLNITDVINSIRERITNHKNEIKYYEDFINSCNNDKNLTGVHFDLCKKYIQNIKDKQNIIKEDEAILEYMGRN